jgi:hypothetical protein
MPGDQLHAPVCLRRSGVDDFLVARGSIFADEKPLPMSPSHFAGSNDNLWPAIFLLRNSLRKQNFLMSWRLINLGAPRHCHRESSTKPAPPRRSRRASAHHRRPIAR